MVGRIDGSVTAMASSGFYATASIDEYGLHLKLGCLGSEQLGDVLGCPARIYPEVIRGL